jgi:hypothetical protein
MKTNGTIPKSSGGFTDSDLLIVLVTVILLGTLAYGFMPHGGAPGKARRIACVSNLKQVGLAARMWANDHNDIFPSQLSEPIRADDTNRLVRFALGFSNELSTPKVLVCPADKERQRISDWPELTTSNISYFLALGASFTNVGVLAGDRNISGGALLNPHCRVFLARAPAGWTEKVHNLAGNLLLTDGSVQQVTSNGLWKELGLKSNRVVRLALP